MKLIILKDQRVIDIVETDDLDNWTYPLDHDSTMVDEDEKINIGDFYEESENQFYRPI